MNVPADVMVKLAQVLGVSGDTKAEGVARTALERLMGPKEYYLEVLDPAGRWDFFGIYFNFSDANAVRAAQLARYPDGKYRIVELTRRVLP